MRQPLRPLPTPRGEEAVFYDHLREHELVFQRCPGCGSVVFPLRALCPGCGRQELVLETSSGRGIVYSFTEQHRAAHPFFVDDVPYTLALAELEEGFRVLGAVPDAEGIAVGAPLLVEYDDVDADFTLLRFRLDPPAAGEARS